MQHPQLLARSWVAAVAMEAVPVIDKQPQAQATTRTRGSGDSAVAAATGMMSMLMMHGL